MSQYLFNEEVIWEDKRKGSYLVPFIIVIVILAACAVLSCLLPKIVYSFAVAPAFLVTLANFLIPTANKIIFASIFGVLAFVLLLVMIISFRVPRLFVTPKRLCLMLSKRNYKEARFDKIDAIKVRGHKIKVYADGKKVFGFGPIENPFATRNCIANMIELPYAEDSCGCGCEDEQPEFGEIGSFGRDELE